MNTVREPSEIKDAAIGPQPKWQARLEVLLTIIVSAGTAALVTCVMNGWLP